MGMIYYLVFQYNRGALNDILSGFGVGRIAWLSSGPGAIAIIILVNTLQFAGISMVIYLAGLQAICPEYEAAALDGASGWHCSAPSPSRCCSPPSCRASSSTSSVA